MNTCFFMEFKVRMNVEEEFQKRKKNKKEEEEDVNGLKDFQG